MNSSKTINIETLIPSSLLEEEYSDNESISNKKFKKDISSKEEIEQKNKQENVNYIFLFNYYIIG